MNVPIPPPRGRSVSELLEAATQLFAATLLKCLPFAMIGVLCMLAPNLYGQLSGESSQAALAHDPNYLLLSLGGFVGYILMISTVMLQQRALAGGGAGRAADAFREALRRLPVLVLASLLGALSLLIGVVLLVIPAVYLLVCFMVLQPVILLEPVGPYTAIVRCVKLIRPMWLKTGGALLVGLVAVLVASVVLAIFIYLVAAVLSGQRAAYEAVSAAATLAVQAVVATFFSALALTLHAAASAQSSASSSV